MMNLIFRVSLTLFFLCAHSVSAQQCDALFKKASLKFKQISASQAGLNMKYAVNVHMMDGDVHSDRIEVSAFNNRVKIVSDDFTIYQDTKAMVVIQPEASTIFITTPADNAYRKSQLQSFMILQDSLLKNMQLKNCVAEIAEKNIRKLAFQLSPRLAQNVSISSICYWIEEGDAVIKKIEIRYIPNEDQRIKTIVFEFHLMNDQYRNAPFQGLASAKVLDAKNALRSEYKNYTLIDKRK